MFSSGKKGNVDAERRIFNKNLTSKYFFTEVGGKAVCLLCEEKITIFKDYHLGRHYETKHEETYQNLTDAERAWTSETLLAKLQKQQGFFTQASHIQGCSSQDQLCDIPQYREKQ